MEARIKLAIFDLDGTLTNGLMTFDHEGNVSKSYHTRDISGLLMLINAGIDVLVLTGSNHACDRHRFAFLADHRMLLESVFYPRPVRPLSDVIAQGVQDKVKYLGFLLEKRHLSWKEVAYMGDAENDADAMDWAGWSACPSDAHEDIISKAMTVMHYPGGHGAVREFADILIRTAERLDFLTKKKG